MTRREWAIIGLCVCAEAGFVVTHPQAARHTLRVVYNTLWYYAPKPAGYVPPQRF
jgi:hypothetical protein